MSTTTTSTSTPASDEPRAQAKETRFIIDRSLIKFGEYKGFRMPYYKEPPEVHMPKIINLTIRDTDVILLTYPKSGTHWAWRVLDMLAAGGAEYSTREMETSGLHLVPAEVLDRISTDTRRVFYAHFISELLPVQLKEGRAKVVHVYRHPKAVLASLALYMKKAWRSPDLTLDKLEAMMDAHTAPYKGQFDYFDKMKEYERDNPNVDIFHLAYEDLKKDTAGCIKQLAAHLNVDASDELCASIAEAVSFSAQKKQEESVCGLQKDTQIYRKGEVDDWKNYMTVAQSERIDKVMADRAASCQFCRRYCPAITTDQDHVYRLSSTS